MAVRVITLKTLVEFKVAKLVWNVSFKPEYLNVSEIKYDLDRKWEIKLTDYREMALENLDYLLGSNEIPFYSESTIKTYIYSIHESYHKLLVWKITYDPLDKIDMFRVGELYAPNYFSIYGDFADYAWVKCFINNNYNTTKERFRLASSYWFSHECAILWTELKNSYISSFGDHCELSSYFKESLGIISFMILHLDFPLTAPERDWREEENFWKTVFEHAVEMGYEYAVYYAWEMIPESEKTDIMHNDEFFELMSNCIEFSDGEICYFLFSLLSAERKQDLFVWTIENDKLEVWHSLLMLYHKTGDVNEIIHFYFHVPEYMYFGLTKLLVHRIKQLHLPNDIAIILMLWKELTPIERHKILASGELVGSLAKRHSFCLLIQIIKNLLLVQKDDILLNDCYGAGVTILNILCKEGEFGVLQKYLGVFFIDIDKDTHEVSLRNDATAFFQIFLNSLAFQTWYEMGISEKYDTQIMRAIEALRAQA